MRNDIRLGLFAALAAVGISATSAAAAVPVWFDGADRNNDGRVSWSEYARHNDAFEALDENGDGFITRSDEYGRTPRSSWLEVASFDLDRSGGVTAYEYTRQLKAVFEANDRNADGALSEREADTRTVRAGRDGRDGPRTLGARAAARTPRS